MPAPLVAPQNRPANTDADFSRWLALLITAQAVGWTVLPWLFARSLPLDVVSDGLAWGHEWQWGYYKHPPLPSWTVEAFFDVFGDIGPFLLSQFCIVVTYIFVFVLGREIMGARRAAVGTLLLVGVYYFSVPTPEFNHNVAQMPVWAAACLCYYRAWKTDSMRWWMALGAVVGVGLLTKYSTAVLLFVILVHFSTTRGAKGALVSRGAWLATLVCLLIVSMHVLWLFRNGFPTMHYAAARAGASSSVTDRFLVPLKFVAAQSVDIAAAFFLAWISGLRRLTPAVRHDRNLHFLLWMTFGPPAVALLGAFVTGMGVRDMWGAPMWNLIGLVIVLATAENCTGVKPLWLGAGAVALFGLGLLAFVLADVVIPEHEDRPSRIQWPDRELAVKVGAVWREQVHAPLTIVAADGWLGGLVAMRSVPRPSVWIDADYRKSPWITPDVVRRQGVLLLWRIRPGQSEPAAFITLKGLRSFGRTTFIWPQMPKAVPLDVGYAILPPRRR